MSLPAILLWRTQIRWAKKIAILGLFSLSIITMVIAIVRVASINLTRRPDGNLDSTYLWLWSFIEPCVGTHRGASEAPELTPIPFRPSLQFVVLTHLLHAAIVISCLSAFPQLFQASARNKKPSFTPSETYLRMMSRIRAKRNDKQGGDSWAELNSVSQSTAVDHSLANQDLERYSRGSQDNRQPVLVPHSHEPVAYAYRGTPRNQSIEIEDDRITHQIEFTVTKQSSPDQD